MATTASSPMANTPSASGNNQPAPGGRPDGDGGDW